jgi:hypothetical protein
MEFVNSFNRRLFGFYHFVIAICLARSTVKIITAMGITAQLIGPMYPRPKHAHHAGRFGLQGTGTVMR